MATGLFLHESMTRVSWVLRLWTWESSVNQQRTALTTTPCKRRGPGRVAAVAAWDRRQYTEREKRAREGVEGEGEGHDGQTRVQTSHCHIPASSKLFFLVPGESQETLVLRPGACRVIQLCLQPASRTGEKKRLEARWIAIVGNCSVRGFCAQREDLAGSVLGVDKPCCSCQRLEGVKEW